jgi:signal transduction histidine kinase
VNPLRSTLLVRFALAMTLVTVLAVTVAAGFLYARFSATNGMFREGTLRSFSQRLATDLRDDPAGAWPSAAAIEAAGGVFAVLTEDGTLRARSPTLSQPLAPVQPAREMFFTLPSPRGGEPLFGYALHVSGPDGPLVVQVAFPQGHVLFDSILEEFVEDIAWIWLPFLLGILATAILVGRIALRPLSLAASQAEAIGPGSVGRRLTEGRMPRDVLALVQAVNRSLDRLQQGYNSLEEFVGDVAHELRTPLSIMKAHVAASRTPLARTLEEDLATMERLVSQLLDRVRLGGLHVEAGDQADLVEIARDAAAMVAPSALASGRSLALLGEDGPVIVVGARDFLVRAVRNLVENAVVHAPGGSTVTITVTPAPMIEIRDQGRGFPARLMDPALRRGRELRSDRSDGVGLGLSIVERTMVAHGGRLDLANAAEGGGVARLVFPRSASL